MLASDDTVISISNSASIVSAACGRSKLAVMLYCRTSLSPLELLPSDGDVLLVFSNYSRARLPSCLPTIPFISTHILFMPASNSPIVLLTTCFQTSFLTFSGLPGTFYYCTPIYVVDTAYSLVSSRCSEYTSCVRIFALPCSFLYVFFCSLSTPRLYDIAIYSL